MTTQVCEIQENQTHWLFLDDSIIDVYCAPVSIYNIQDYSMNKLWTTKYVIK